MKNADGCMDSNHSTVYTSANILAHPSVQLTQGGLILIGLLSGGDYHQAGFLRCVPGIAHRLAKCGFGYKLLNAAHSLPCNKLPDFLTTWCNDLCTELCINACGHLGSRKPSLAKAVPDSFPNIDILLLYTNPIISMTDTGTHCTHTLPKWECEPDLGKLACLCELHFEWGLKDVIIKRFCTIIWPSIVLCALQLSVMDAATDCCGESRELLQDVSRTLSKLLARHLSSMDVGGHNTGGEGDSGPQELIMKIHSSQMHAYTDSILEYRLEVAPLQLVCPVSAHIQGLRKPVDTTYDVLPSESEDESGGDLYVGDMWRQRKKHSAGPPPGPDSHLHMWMPACMVCPALPELVEQYEARLKVKHAKKSKGKQQVPPAITNLKTKLSPSSKIADLPMLVDSDTRELSPERHPPILGGSTHQPSQTLHWRQAS
jgi:Holliday junction resolvase YEN1